MKRIIASILTTVIAFSLTGCARRYYVREEVVFKDSGISLRASLYDGDVAGAFDGMLALLKSFDEEINLSNPESVLSRFNNSVGAGVEVEVSGHTYDIIDLALKYEEETGGAFSIAAYNLSKLWNLDTEGVKKFNPVTGEPLYFALPSMDEVKQTLSYSNISCFNRRADEQTGKYYISKSDARFKIDLGAIAKGYFADLCYKMLNTYEVDSAVINISGNLIVKGKLQKTFGSKDWGVRIKTPRDRFELDREDICAFEVESGTSLVTSGDYERYYYHASGIIPCHIIDPRTGLPAGVEFSGSSDSDNTYKMKDEWLSSVTIINKSSAKADAFSTAAFVMGFDDAYEFLKGREGVRAVMFTEKETGVKPLHGRLGIAGGVEFIETKTYSGFKSYETVKI